MTSYSRSASGLAARASLVAVVLSFAAFGLWTAGGLSGQPPAQKKQRVEEEEEAPKDKKTKRKVIPIPEDADPKAKTKSATRRASGPAPIGDLAQLAKQENHPAIKALFDSLAVRHDVALRNPSSFTTNRERRQQEDKIVPIPFYLGKDPGRYRGERLLFTPLTLEWQRGKSFEPVIENLQSVTPYEEIAQDKVRQFLRESYADLSRYDMLVAAEQALSDVLRWHESARATRERRGEEWEDVGKTLRKQLLDGVLMEQMELLARIKDWDKVIDLTRRLAVAYGKGPGHERIFQPVADMIKRALNDPTGDEDKKQKARERLHNLEMEFPDNPAFRPLSDTLSKQAEILLTAAKDQAAAKNVERARGYLERAEKTWPQLPGLRKFKAELNNEHPILRVGVRGPLPKYFSPAWACTDNERRVVEMLFESLVKLVPDEAGGFRYGRGLAESSPKVVPLGRLFQLPTKAVWSNGQLLTSVDIDFSLRNLQKDGSGVGRSRVWGELLAEVETKKDQYQPTLRMTQGFLDPLAPMTFKILPVDKLVNSEEFAQNPVTSGPFRLDLSRHSDEGQRECLFFVANPDYSIRPAKRDLPHIQEIRFYSCPSNTNVAKELESGKLDLVLDLTAKEAEELRKNPNANIMVPTPSPSVPNRRIYFLAINTRKLGAAEVRQALSCAINREALLNKHFRVAGKAALHKALNGPFPTGSWACKAGPELYNRDNANLLKNQPAVIAAKSSPWVLKYASNNPAEDEAMRELCAQVKELTGLVLEPKSCDPHKLREDVEHTKNYDLAYYHYDFPDESYWLAPLFGPPPGREDITNIFKYDNVKLTELLDGTKSYRDFSKVQEHQKLIHDFLNREMPFIPLWQLDPLLAYRREVQPAAMDPLLPLGNVEEWRLQHK